MAANTEDVSGARWEARAYKVIKRCTVKEKGWTLKSASDPGLLQPRIRPTYTTILPQEIKPLIKHFWVTLITAQRLLKSDGL